jgi:acyl dehydratase
LASEFNQTRHAITAFAECQEMRALAPVFPGDTIRVQAKVTATEPGGKPLRPVPQPGRAPGLIPPDVGTR